MPTEVKGIVRDKWEQMRKGSPDLEPTCDEGQAAESRFGTTGRYQMFATKAWTMEIDLHTSGPHRGRAFEVHGAIHYLYWKMGGTGSPLGFPISDEYDVEGGRRSDFEGGYTFWERATNDLYVYVCHGRFDATETARIGRFPDRIPSTPSVPFGTPVVQVFTAPVDQSKRDVRVGDQVMPQASQPEPFRFCPFCRTSFKLAKTPKFCPQCGEELAMG